MRILFATNHAHLPQAAGGSQSSTHDLAIEFQKLGHTAAVVSNLAAGDIIWLKNRSLSRIFHEKFPCDQRYPYRVYRGFSQNGTVSAISSVVDRFRPDLAIVQAGQPAPIATELLNHGIRTVLYLRDIEFGKLGGEVPQNDRLTLIANSQFTADRFFAFSGRKAWVCPPLVRSESYLTSTTRKEVLFINPVPEKGVDTAIALAKRLPETKFRFVEAWPLTHSKLSALRKRLSALPNVTFQLKTKDMRTVYRHAQVVLVPSRGEEAWGRVVTEAQFSGIPALASNIGGLSESVGPGGILASPDASLDEWEQNLRFLLENANYDDYVERALAHSYRDEIKPRSIINTLFTAIGHTS